MSFVLQPLRQTSEQQRSLTRAGGDNLMPLINTVTRPTPVIFLRWFSNIPLAFSSLHGVENSQCVFWVLVACFFVICVFRPAYGTGFSPTTSVFPVITLPKEFHTHIRLLPTVYSLGHDCSKVRGAGSFGKFDMHVGNMNFNTQNEEWASIL